MTYLTRSYHHMQGISCDHGASQDGLTVFFEEALTAARPHLLRIARGQGVPADAAEDIVQDTCVEAWRHLDRLHTPEGIDAWLSTICRQICRRWLRAEQMTVARHTRLFPPAAEQEGSESVREREIPDPLAVDPVDELNRHDLSILLDHALHLLPNGTRLAIELCYLAELPPREAALRLGISLNALDVRLHRARHTLRQALCGSLRADAEIFGLDLDQEVSTGWRETRQWCHLCGQRRLRGCLEPQADGRVCVRLRCPDCSPGSCDMFASSQPQVARSFGSAYKRAWKADFAFWMQALAHGFQRCGQCRKHLVPVHVVRPDELAVSIPYPNTYRTILDCPACGITTTCSVAGLLVHPSVSRFIGEHPRWMIGPESADDSSGLSVIRTCLRDWSSSAQLTVIVQRQTLQVLATFPA